MAVRISQRSVAKLAILLRGKRFPRGLLLDIRWDSFSRSVAKLAILLRGGRFLRGLLLDIRWESLNRSVAKLALLLRGRRFLRGLLLDIRWDPVNRSAAYFHYGPRWLPGSRWCNAATKCSSTIGYFLKNSSLGPYLCGLTLRHGKATIAFGWARRRRRNRDHCGASGKKKEKQRTEPPRLEFSTVRGLFYIKKIQRVKQRIRHRKLQSAIENSF